MATLDASGKLVEAQLPVIKQAENANTINNNKLIKMTKAEYEAAVKEDNTIYLVYEAGV